MLKIKAFPFHRFQFIALAVMALCIPALCLVDSAFADDWEVSEEEVNRILEQTVPMPFPDPETLNREIPDEPVRMVYKYNPALWPMEETTQDDDRMIARKLASGHRADDGPLRIEDTEEYPYSSVVNLLMEFDVGYAGCSGSFVKNSQVVLTAGHCIYNAEYGGFPESITVVPGKDGSSKPFGSKEAINWATNNSWINWEDPTNDWAVIIVRPFDGDTGYMDTYYETGSSWYSGRDFETAGYPGDEGYNGSEMWWDMGRAVYMMYGMIEIDFDFGGEYDCIHGQSGSAMYTYYDGGYKVAAVLTLANCMGPRINGTIENFLDDYDCGGCFVEDTCYLDGDPHPTNPCRICDHDADAFGWSDNNGAVCDDGEYCNGADACQDQACIVHEGNPCSASQTCDENAEECVGTAIDNDMCNGALNLIYEDCGLGFAADGSTVNRDTAFSWCMQNQGPWDCILECVDHPDVNTCGDLDGCLSSKCDIEVDGDSGGDDDDDDDDDGGQCGGLF